MEGDELLRLILQLAVLCFPWCKLYVSPTTPAGFPMLLLLSPIQENWPPEGEPGIFYITIFGLLTLSTGFLS